MCDVVRSVTMLYGTVSIVDIVSLVQNKCIWHSSKGITALALLTTFWHFEM